MFYLAIHYNFRYESNSGGEREIQRTMLELLNQLDGFDSRGDVKVGRVHHSLDIAGHCGHYTIKAYCIAN